MTVFIAPNVYAGNVDVKVKGSVGQMYDDNLTYTPTNQLSDFVSLVSAGIDLMYEGERTVATLSTTVFQQLYWEFTEFNNTSNHTAVRLRYDLSKFDHITVSDSFSRSYEPLDFEEELSRASGHYQYDRNRFDLIYERNMSENLSVKVNYGNEIENPDRSDLLDSFVNRISVESQFALSTKMIFITAYEHLNRNIDPGEEANVNTFMGGLKLQLTEQLSLEGRAGVDLIESFNGESISEPLWSIVLVDQLNERDAIHLSFSQRNSTNASTDNIFNSWRISGGVDSRLLKRLSGSASMFIGEGKYKNLDIKDQVFGGNLAFLYEFSTTLKGSLSYTYSEINSNLDSREYSKNVIYVSITKEF